MSQSPPEVRVVTRDRFIFVEPDPALRDCLARLPRRSVSTEAEVAQLIADSFEVGDDCRSKLSATWQSIDATRRVIDAMNEAKGEEP